MMTTTGAILGALPLAIGLGEGSELRQPLGISIVGGLFLSQILTLYTTPVVFLYMDRFGKWTSRILEQVVPRHDEGQAGRSRAGAEALAGGVAGCRALASSEFVAHRSRLLARCETADLQIRQIVRRRRACLH